MKNVQKPYDVQDPESDKHLEARNLTDSGTYVKCFTSKI